MATKKKIYVVFCNDSPEEAWFSMKKAASQALKYQTEEKRHRGKYTPVRAWYVCAVSVLDEPDSKYFICQRCKALVLELTNGVCFGCVNVLLDEATADRDRFSESLRMMGVPKGFNENIEEARKLKKTLDEDER